MYMVPCDVFSDGGYGRPLSLLSASVCVDVIIGWVPCDLHSSLCTDASHLLLVATTFKCQDGISCLCILTMHDVCALRLALLSVYIAVAVCKAPHYLCVDVVVGWVPCDSHSSLCTDASRLLLVATTFKLQDGIICLGILTMHDVIHLHVGIKDGPRHIYRAK